MRSTGLGGTGTPGRIDLATSRRLRMAPRVDFAVLARTNRGGPLAAKAADDAASTLIRHYLK